MRRLVLLALAAFACCASGHAQTVIAPGSNKGGGGSGTVTSCATTNATPRYTGATTLDCGSPVDTLTDLALSAGETFTLPSSTSGLKTVQSTDSAGNLLDKMPIPSLGAVTVALAGGGAGNLSNGVYSYKATCVTASGETDAGTVSGNVTVVDHTANGKVAVSAIPVCAGPATARNLYRTVHDGSTYKLVANNTIADNFTTTYTDNIADASLGAVAPTTNTTLDQALKVSPGYFSWLGNFDNSGFNQSKFYIDATGSYNFTGWEVSQGTVSSYLNFDAGGGIASAAAGGLTVAGGSASEADVILTAGTVALYASTSNITPVLKITASGALQTGAGTTPSVANVGANSCGTSAASATGNENTLAITTGATSATQCRLTFATAATNRRQCVANNDTTNALISTTYVDTTHTDVKGTLGAASVLSVNCMVY